MTPDIPENSRTFYSRIAEILPPCKKIPSPPRHHMAEFMETSPYIYIQKRYVNGYDQALQERLLGCADEKELEDRKQRAKQHGKYGNMLKNLVGRQQRGREFVYEAEWENLPDSKQNTWLVMDDLRKLGCESFALAYDSRVAVSDEVRPLSQREICKHLEQFGITEELALNRNIGRRVEVLSEVKFLVGDLFWFFIKKAKGGLVVVVTSVEQGLLEVVGEVVGGLLERSC